MTARRDWIALLFCVAVAASFVIVWQLTAHAPGSFDIYMHHVPGMLYAARQLADGGRGLLWNPLQNCGQPFFAISGTGLLYPPYWLFFVLNVQQALWFVTTINLTIAGVGTFALGRELGVSRTAALCGAVAFQLGNASFDVNTWSPMYGSPYAWFPAALCCCERILRDPSARKGVALALVLTLALLPASPQIVFFAYQLIALRLMWELATRRIPDPLATLRAFGIGLILPPLLSAVHLLPSVEMAAASVRNRALTMVELIERGGFDWAKFRTGFGRRQILFNPLTVVPLLFAAAAPFRPRGRRVILFYLVAGLVYFVLSFGPNTPLFDWYLRLPMTQTFREPTRFLWVTSLCLAVLTAFGADAFAWRDPMVTIARRLRPLVPVLAALGAYFLSPTGLLPLEWSLVIVLAAAATFSLVGCRSDWRAWIALSAVSVNLLAFPLPSFPKAAREWSGRSLSFRSLAPDPGVLSSSGPLFEWLRSVVTAQDRIGIVYQHSRYSLMPKSASIFGVPAAHDYEPAPTRRSAEFAVMLRTGRPMRDLNSFYYGGALASPLPGPLLSLAAARYVVVDTQARDAGTIAARMRPIWERGEVKVYENDAALPRAYYVPRAEVVADPQRLLVRLARGTDDSRQLMLLEDPPPSGFLGAGQPISGGTVEFVTNDPERVVLQVTAPERGFVHLADQYFTGWHATVNGASTPILRANFLFRAVEVPAGASVVEFRYAPLSVQVGAGISVLTVVGVLTPLIVSTRRRGQARVQPLP